MKLEFLPDGPDDSGLIRLYDYSQSDVHALSKIASELATGSRKQIALQSESWVAPIGGCKLILQRGERDSGIRQVGPLDFANGNYGPGENGITVEELCAYSGIGLRTNRVRRSTR
jgi:hypothetical protein